MTNLSGKELEDVLDRLAKMRNLAERAGTPAEAAVATQKLQESLLKYNLSMTEIESHDPKSRRGADGRFIKKTINVGTATAHLTMWKLALLEGICQANYARSVYTKGPPEAFLIGRPEVLPVIEGMYEYLVDTIAHLCKVAWRNYPPAKHMTQYQERMWKESYRLGAVSTINYRMHQQKLLDQQKYVTDTSLVIVMDDDLDNALKSMFAGLGQEPPLDPKNGEAFMRGNRDGRNINLDKQVGRG